MSSIPMTSPGDVGRLGVVGCNSGTDPSNSPQSKTCNLRPVDSNLLTNARSKVPVRRIPESLNPEASISATSEVEESEAESAAAPLHRIREVREQQGVSIRSMARRMGIDVRSYKHIENPYRDLTISELGAVQKALDVPLADLLVDREGLASPVQERAKLVKAMKTAVAIKEVGASPRIDRMAQMLCEQLRDIMPELEDISGWPQFGARRGQSALGKALREPIDTSSLGLND